MKSNDKSPLANSPDVGEAIFAGGCFWGMEHLMRQQEGVLDVMPGYIGGDLDNPTYQQVKSQTTGHAEAVKVKYDPRKISYEEIAKLFFEIHDPTQEGGQGIDIGDQYRSEVFYLSQEQKKIAEKLINILKGKGLAVVTRVTPATHFYPAEEYHRKYFLRHSEATPCHIRVHRF
jgi:peptide methionine sulfoxide reductase msrA/msrB